MFQRRFMRGEAQRTIQHQCVRFAYRPDHGIHRVTAQLLKRRDALVAVDDQVTVGLVGHGYDDDRRLLSQCGERCQEPLLLAWMAHPQVLPAPVELVKLQLHGRLAPLWGRRHLVL